MSDLAFPPSGPTPPRGGSRAFIVTLLVIACVLLGAAVGWGIKQRRERAFLSDRNRRVEDAYTFVLAKRNDLANFLTDARTRLIRLDGQGPMRGQSITVAWQDERRSGVIIADAMPTPADGHGYVVWLVPQGGGAAVRCSSRLGGSELLRPDSGMTCYEFRALEFGGKAGGFFLTEEFKSDAKSPGGTPLYDSRGDKRA